MGSHHPSVSRHACLALINQAKKKREREEQGIYGQRTLAEADGVGDDAQALRVAVAGGVAKDDGDVEDALDVAFAVDDGVEGVAGLDGVGDGDARDARVGEREERGGCDDKRAIHCDVSFFDCY